jgi:hypothetical protein
VKSCFPPDEASTRKPKFWWFGLAVGAAASSVVTIAVVVWEWLENPGGVFRNELGTNWKFISDTAISWFAPTFIYLTLIASAAHLAWWIVRRQRKRGERQ